MGWWVLKVITRTDPTFLNSLLFLTLFLLFLTFFYDLSLLFFQLTTHFDLLHTFSTDYLFFELSTHFLI